MRENDVTLELTDVRSAAELHEMLFEKLSLPDYYGGTWDAFGEVITEQQVLPSLLRLEGWSDFERRLPREAGLMRECLTEFTREFPRADFRVEYVTRPLYTCPCCGYVTLSEPPGSYDICPICFWEDDALQLEFPTTLAGGANGPTLVEAQRNCLRTGASEPRLRQYVRKPQLTDMRDPEWRPIDAGRDVFEDFHSDARVRAPAGDDTLYYWRSTFWRKAGRSGSD